MLADGTHNCDAFATVPTDGILDWVNARRPRFPITQPQTKSSFIEVHEWLTGGDHLRQLHPKRLDCTGLFVE